MIETGDERGSRKSVLAAWQDEDNDDDVESDISTEGKQMTHPKLNFFYIELFDHLAMCKQMTCV